MCFSQKHSKLSSTAVPVRLDELNNQALVLEYIQRVACWSAYQGIESVLHLVCSPSTLVQCKHHKTAWSPYKESTFRYRGVSTHYLQVSTLLQCFEQACCHHSQHNVVNYCNTDSKLSHTDMSWLKSWCCNRCASSRISPEVCSLWSTITSKFSPQQSQRNNLLSLLNAQNTCILLVNDLADCLHVLLNFARMQ